MIVWYVKLVKPLESVQYPNTVISPDVGKISDISAEGCCLETELPIRANQYIYIEVEIAEDKISKIFGKIVAVEINSSTNKHILHIKFVKIDKTTRNSIYSLIYNY